MKKISKILFLSAAFILTQMLNPALIFSTSNPIMFSNSAYAADIDDCYKIYPQDPDILFMSAISALSSSNKFNLSEIQSKNGYILFAQGQKFYLLTLTKKYKNQTEIKILPQNSDYTNAMDVAREAFLLIDNKLKYPKMEQVK